MATSPQFAAVARSPHIVLTNASGTSPVTIFTIGSTGGIVRAVWAVSNDTTARWITLLHSDATTSAVVASLKLNAAIATAPYRQVNFFDPSKLTQLDAYEPQWHLEAGHSFAVRMESAVTSGAYAVNVFALYGEF
jgi:hypothetical protein